MRMKHSVFIFITVFLFGCSNTYIIQPDDPIHITKFGTINKKDLRSIDIREFYASSDSIFAIKHDTNELLKFHKSEIKNIVFIDRGKGSKDGAIYTALGAMLLVLILPDNPDDALGSRAAGLIIAPPLYGSMGALVGFMAGSREKYEFPTNTALTAITKEEPLTGGVQESETPTISEAEESETPAVTEAEQTETPAVTETETPIKTVIKESRIDENKIKEKMLSISKQPVKAPKFYFSFEIPYALGGFPIIETSKFNAGIEESGTGIGGTYQLFFPLKHNIHLGISAGGIETIQDYESNTITRSVENFDLTARFYPIIMKNFYIKGAVGYSKFTQKTELDESGLNGKRVMVGIGNSIVRGKNYEILISSDISFNTFEDSKSAIMFGIGIGIMFPGRVTASSL